MITYEFENIDADCLKWLSENAYVPQGVKLLEITQDRVTEKAAIQNAGVDVAPYAVIESEADIYRCFKNPWISCCFKNSHEAAMTERANSLFTMKKKFLRLLLLLNAGTCVLEKWIPFEKEISVIICRNAERRICCFSSRRKYS